MIVLGIDIGKRELLVRMQENRDGAVQILGKRGPFANTPAGYQELTAWMLKRVTGEVQVVMEATNVYWERCAHHFHDLGYRVSVVNPAQIKYVARSVLRRGKTDAMNAEIIARYGLVMQPGCWAPPSTVLMDLKTLTREREAVLARRTQENNHLIALRDAHHVADMVLTLAQQRLDLLDRQLASLDAALHELVEADAALAQQLKLLLSVPGFAYTSAATILAETVGFSRMETAEEISAAAGMAPSPQQSGSKMESQKQWAACSTSQTSTWRSYGLCCPSRNVQTKCWSASTLWMSLSRYQECLQGASGAAFRALAR